jgi:hypothetical protein
MVDQPCQCEAHRGWAGQAATVGRLRFIGVAKRSGYEGRYQSPPATACMRRDIAREVDTATLRRSRLAP